MGIGKSESIAVYQRRETSTARCSITGGNSIELQSGACSILSYRVGAVLLCGIPNLISVTIQLSQNRIQNPTEWNLEIWLNEIWKSDWITVYSYSYRWTSVSARTWRHKPLKGNKSPKSLFWFFHDVIYKGWITPPKITSWLRLICGEWKDSCDEGGMPCTWP